MTKPRVEGSHTVFTIGHSTRDLSEFLDMLKAHGVTMIADVRSVPRSRHNPQYNMETLPGALTAAGIGYVHLAGLGGLRHPRADSPNMAWRNTSFRGFADYMQTGQFAEHLASLLELSKEGRIALMCAEAVPWRCHRSLIADALAVRGVAVEHIMSAVHLKLHALTPWARVEEGHVTYPATALPAAQAEPQH